MPQTSIHLRVAFADTDASGRIHFTAMLRYMDVAEHTLMRELGFPHARTFSDIEFPRVHVSCDFQRAIGYDDELTLNAVVTQVGRRSWSVSFTSYFTHELEEQGTVAKSATSGKLTMVAVDTKTGRSVSIPDELRAALAADLK